MKLSDDGTILLEVSDSDIQNGAFTIPESVTHIDDGAFAGCSGLTQITIPKSVTHIASSAFLRCTGLTKITIPESVTHIGDLAFSGCSGLTQITIPESVTHIGYSAFAGCSGLTQITIPESVTHIGVSAFAGCLRLTQFTIPESVTHIGNNAFAGCSGLTQITIPESVTHIGVSAFAGCSGLTQFTIPESVTHIGNNAFMGCAGLTQITIPNSVTHIGDGAFRGCGQLRVIVIDATNEEEYQRIMALMPQESRNLVVPFEFSQKIKKAKQQALMSIKSIVMDSYLTILPESVINIIQQYDERLHNVINQVPLPHQPQELDGYKQALKVALSQFNQEQEALLEPIRQRERDTRYQRQGPIVIGKLQKFINMTKEAIQAVKNKNAGFFDSPGNKQNLEESQARIAVATKLITWLSGDKSIKFTADEKELLRKPESAVALILTNNGIQIEELPEAPSSKGDYCNIM